MPETRTSVSDPTLSRRHLVARQRAGIDGFMPSGRTVRRNILAERPHAPPKRHLTSVAPRPKPGTSFAAQHRHFAFTFEEPQVKRSSRLVSLLKDMAVIFLGLALGFFVYSLVVGQIILLIYAVCAIVFRIASRTTFLLALMSLGMVLFATVQSKSALASVFAVYAFLLLTIGTLSLGREARTES